MKTILGFCSHARFNSGLLAACGAVLGVAALPARAANTVVGDWSFTNSVNPGWSLERTTTLTPAGIQMGTPGVGNGMMTRRAPAGLSFTNSGVEMIFIGTATACNGAGVQYLSLDNTGYRCCFGLGAPTGPGDSVSDGTAWLNQNYNLLGGENLTRTDAAGSNIKLLGRHAMALVRFDDLTLRAYIDGVEIGSRVTDSTGSLHIDNLGVGYNTFGGATYLPAGTLVERVRAFTFPHGGFDVNQVLLARTNAPATPAGLTATPGNRVVSLSWTKAQFATGYNVKRSLTPGGPYAVIGTSADPAYTDTALLNGTAYSYVVSATNILGQSADSAQASATPTMPPLPSVPAGLTLTATNTLAGLSWSASTSATGYAVKRALAKGGPYSVIGATAGTAYADTLVASNTTYHYVVAATNVTGESAASAQVSTRVLFPVWQHSASFFILTTPSGADLAASAAETNFPVLVRLTSDFFSFSQARANGGDLRFATANGVFLPYEIEQWDPAGGTAAIWVRVPLITGNASQEIKMYWGSADALNGSCGSAVFNAGSGFASVFHLSDATTDSTGSTAPVNAGTTTTAGRVGPGRHFAAGQGIACGTGLTNLPYGNNPHSSATWFRADAAGTSLLGWGLPTGQAMVGLQIASPPTVNVNCWGGGGGVSGTGTVALSQWIHLAHTYQDGQARLYLNGVLDGTHAGGGMNIPTPGAMSLGGFGRYSFAGDLDEVRISSVARSADWVKMEYENQKPLQTLVGNLVQAGSDFSVSAKQVTLSEGKSATVTAKAGGARKVYWVIKQNGQETLVAADQLSYTLAPGRVAGEQALVLQFKAVYPAGVQTRDIPVTIKEVLPDPVYTLTAPSAWDGRQTVTVTPSLSNWNALLAAGVTNLNYNWTVAGLAVTTVITNGALRLLLSQGSGPLTVTLALDNGGAPVTRTAVIAVQEPATDPWAARTPDANEKPVNNQFYARDDTGYGTVYYRGTLGGAPDSVFLKVYANGPGGDVLCTNLSQTLSSGAYAFTARIASGLVTYKVVFGSITGTATNILDTVTNLVCGDAYLIDGQSNAVADNYYGDTNAPLVHYTNPWIRSYGQLGGGTGGGWGNAVSCSTVSGDTYNIGIWGMCVASNLLATYHMPICILNVSVGGTMIRQHQPNPANHYDAGGGTYSIYANLITRVAAAKLTHGIRGVMWHQGEANANNWENDGDWDYKFYQGFFLNMSAAWKQDMPNLRCYYLFQIFPGGCASGTCSPHLREVQRNLARLYSHMAVMPTLAFPTGQNCHFNIPDYCKMGESLVPLIGRDVYGREPSRDITAPDLKRAYFTTGDKDEIALVFGQDVAWNSAATSNFFLDHVGGKVTSGSVSGRVIKLRLSGPSTAKTIDYVVDSHWNYLSPNLIYGANGIAALTFFDVPIGK
ncbi:MAG: DUF2341 domain-containing protein [bacterium]